MTIAELILEFRTTYDLGSLGLPGFEDEEIREFLDRAQYPIIDKKIIEDISALNDLMSNSNLATSTTTRGYRLVNLPSDYLHLIEVVVQHSEGDESATLIPYSRVSRFQSSKRNQNAYIKNPVYVFDDNSSDPAIRLYIDSSYSGNPNVNILYVKTPADLKVASTFDDFGLDLYHDIVKIAVDDATLTVSPNKSQLTSQHLNK